MGQDIVVMVGVIVDAQRMHKTKDDWDEFCSVSLAAWAELSPNSI